MSDPGARGVGAKIAAASLVVALAACGGGAPINEPELPSGPLAVAPVASATPEAQTAPTAPGVASALPSAAPAPPIASPSAAPVAPPKR